MPEKTFRAKKKMTSNGKHKTGATKVIADGETRRNTISCDNLIKSLDFAALETNDIWTYDKRCPVRLRGFDDRSPETPVSVMKVFHNTVEQFGTHMALATKVDDKWKTWTYEEYYNDVLQAAKSLIAIGIQPLDGVGIIGFNSPEWFISDLAAIFAGGLAIGIYTTNSPEACKYVVQNSECSVMIVENDTQLQKILSIRSQLPRLKAIVQYKGKLRASWDNVYTWEAFMKLGEGLAEEELHSRIAEQHCNQCCTVIYTSGTVGNPKGVMLSHDNLTWTSLKSGQTVNASRGAEVILSYLPLSHVAAQILDIFIPLTFGATVYFAQPDAMKGSLGDSLKEVRPTIFLGVPRVWEKMAEKMMAALKKSGRVKRSLLDWSRQIGLKGNLSKMNSGPVPIGWTLAHHLVFRKIRTALGLDRCRLCFSAAAPIMKETLEFFASLNIPLFEIFGMSETTGPHTISVPSKWRMTSTGQASNHSPVYIFNPKKDGEGEVLMGGRNIFMGYLSEPEKTKETLDSNFLLRSGDLGKMDQDGFLHITGRIKELIITAGGENVAPAPIEDTVKEILSFCISNCMLIGDKRKFLSLLITLKTEFDPDTSEPKDRLCSSVVQWCRSLGSQVTCVSELLSKTKASEPILSAIQTGIDKANQKAISRAQTIQKWSILPRDFSIPNGELGPTMKLKRHFVAELYSATIESLYKETQ